MATAKDRAQAKAGSGLNDDIGEQKRLELYRTQVVLREAEQRAFVSSLGTEALKRTLDYKSTDGRPFAQPLWQQLQHVVNHGTHHRSEIAAMVTLTKGSPAPTDMVLFYRQPKS